MPFYSLYRVSAEIYLLAKAFATPTVCILGWLLLSRAAAKHLHSYVYWFLPSLIGASLNVVGLLLETYVNFYARRDYSLITVVYLVYLAAVPFHIVSFVRFWKTITALPLGVGEQPQADVAEQDEGVWPPPPRR